ncbi:hypothetical protein HZU73_01519 [Apis mellifera caucasica]|nr:hypothetical protein HZU73_01519 [Apis mellifera caucasica]
MNVLNESTNKLQGTLTFQNYEQKKEFFPLEQAPLLLENEEEEEEEEKKIGMEEWMKNDGRLRNSGKQTRYPETKLHLSRQSAGNGRRTFTVNPTRCNLQRLTNRV